MDKRSSSLGLVERRPLSAGLGISRTHAWQDTIPSSPLNASFATSYNSSLHDRVGSRKASPLRGGGVPGKVTQSPSPSHTAVSTRAPSLGSGASINDLRAVVGVQQQQLDTLTDKIASLLSSGHVGGTQDLQRPRGVPERRTDVAKGEIAHLTDLREMEGGFRVWLQREMHEMQDALESKFRSLREQVRYDVRDPHERLANEMSTLRVHLSHLEKQRIDDDVESDIRQDLEAHVDARVGQLHSSVGEMMRDLRKEIDSQLHGSIGDFAAKLSRDVEQRVQANVAMTMAHPCHQDSPLQQLASEIRRDLEERLREQPAVSNSVKKEIRDEICKEMKEEIREKTQPRLEAHAAQTFGMAQRLINEVRKEIEMQAVQLHESTQRLAQDLQVHMHTSVQQFVHEEMKHGLKELAKCVTAERTHQGSAESGGAAAQENVEVCHAAAEECARCVAETVALSEAMEKRMQLVTHELDAKLQHEHRGQSSAAAAKQKELDTTESSALANFVASAEAAASVAEKHATACTAAVSECSQCVGEAIASFQKEYDERIANMQGGVDDLKRSQEDVVSAVQRVGALEDSCSAAEKEVAVRLSEMERQLAGVRKALDDIPAKDAKPEDSSQSGNVAQRVDDLDRAVAELQSAKSRDGQENEMVSRVAELERTVGLQNSVDTKVDAVARRVDEVARQVEDLESAQSKLPASQRELPKSAPDDSFAQRVDDLDVALKALRTSMDAKVDASELEAKISESLASQHAVHGQVAQGDSLGQRVDDLEAALEVLRTSMDAKVSEKGVADRVPAEGLDAIRSRVAKVEQTIGDLPAVGQTSQQPPSEQSPASMDEMLDRVDALESKVSQLSMLMMGFKQMLEPQDSGDDDGQSVMEEQLETGDGRGDSDEEEWM